MSSNPTVSAIIPAYNAAEFISRAIDSVLAQTYPASEILVVDDGSRDRTVEVAGQYPPPVRVLEKPNGGPASARNLGAREAAGEWLAFLDADDSWLPQKLARQLTLAQPDVGLIHCLYKRFSAEPVPDLVTFDALWLNNHIGCSTVLIRKELYAALGGFDEDGALVGVEDYNLWLRAAATRWRIVTLQERVIHYMPSSGSLTRQVERFANAELTNMHKIAAQFHLSKDQVRRKQLSILDEYGRELLYYRDLPGARKFLGQALRQRFSLKRLGFWSAALLPRAAFELYGGLR